MKNTSVTNTSELNKIGNKLIKGYKGTYPSNVDTDLILLKNGDSCILNTKTSNESGEHWIALKFYDNNIYFFDTYDRDYKTLSPLWKKNKWKQIRFKKSLEADLDTDCGQRCIAFLMLCNKYPPSLVLNSFD